MDKSITQPLTTNESSAATYNPNQNQCSILAQRPSYPMLLSPSPITPFNSYSVKKLDRADPQLSIATLQHGSNAVQVQPTTTATLNKADAPTIDSAEYQKTPAQFEAAQQVGSKPAKKIIAQLNEEELWKSFNEVGNEMIVTKPGRYINLSHLITQVVFKSNSPSLSHTHTGGFFLLW